MEQPEIRSSKRKRNHISYAEDEPQFRNDLNQVGDPEHEYSEGFSDDDYLPKQHARKRKSLASKKDKLASKSKTQRLQKPFPFMRLPAELREHIYDLALVDPNGLQIQPRTKNYRRTVCRGILTQQEYDPLLGYYSRPFYSHRHATRNPQVIGFPEEAGPPEVDPVSLVPNLLAVSKQIHTEATSMLYMQDIILEDTLTLHQFLSVIGSSNIRLLTHLTVRGWGRGRGTHKAMNHSAFALLAGATNLKSLCLDCKIGWFRHRPVHLARQIYRDCHIFFEAYGAANGRKDAGVDILDVNDENFDRENGNYAPWRNRSMAQVPEPETFKQEFQAELRRLLINRPYI